MTSTSSIDLARFLHEHLEQVNPDLFREMLTTFTRAATTMSPSPSSSPGGGTIAAHRLCATAWCGSSTLGDVGAA